MNWCFGQVLWLVSDVVVNCNTTNSRRSMISRSVHYNGCQGSGDDHTVCQGKHHSALLNSLFQATLQPCPLQPRPLVSIAAAVTDIWPVTPFGNVQAPFILSACGTACPCSSRQRSLLPNFRNCRWLPSLRQLTPWTGACFPTYGW